MRPGNPGIARWLATRPADVIADPDAAARARRARTASISRSSDPKLPLSLGVADRFADAGRLLFGPTRGRRAARIEQGVREGVHGAPRRADRAVSHLRQSLDDALRVVRSGEFGFPVVLKADGLAAGKGVVIAEDLAEAEAAVVGRDGRAAVRRRRRARWSSKSA